MKNKKRPVCVIYYRQIPSKLEDFVVKDKKMSITKDGIFRGVGHACPRITVTMEMIDGYTDKVRLQALSELLEDMESRGEIVSYTIFDR